MKKLASSGWRVENDDGGEEYGEARTETSGFLLPRICLYVLCSSCIEAPSKTLARIARHYVLVQLLSRQISLTTEMVSLLQYNLIFSNNIYYSI